MIKIKGTNWVEILAIFVLILGLIATIVSPSKVMFYIIALMSGVLSGRLLYRKNNSMPFKYYFITAAYLVGLIIGNYIRMYGNYLWPISIFIIGAITGFQLTKKRIIKGVSF